MAKLKKSKASGKPLRIKQGFDPTAPDLHIGHAVGLRKLRQFQDLGHIVVVIIGDATASVGDPTDQSETRPVLSADEIDTNAQTYCDQVFNILDESKTEIVRNSSWFEGLGFFDTIQLMAKSTVARLLERDDFQKRYEAGQAIHLHEFMYPLMQGYDSVMIEADFELGATEQKFNMLVGRDLQRDAGQEPQCVLTLPMLVGLDGVKKMSKSLGNYIGLTEPPEEIFGKAMSISDAMMEDYLRFGLSYSEPDAKGLMKDVEDGNLHPRALKARLAGELTALYSSEAGAKRAEEHFEKVHKEKEVPDDIPEAVLSVGDGGKKWICKALSEAGLAKSNGEARRLIRGGGLRIDGERVEDESLELGEGSYLLQSGKRHFLRITLT